MNLQISRCKSGFAAQSILELSTLLRRIQPHCPERIWIGGSAARDALSGERSALESDIDLLFYNAAETSKDYEADIEGRLITLSGAGNLSLKNQARMGKIVDGASYNSLFESVASFPDTSIAIAFCLYDDKNAHPIFYAPYGPRSIDRALISPTSFFLERHGRNAYYSWLKKKQYEKRLANWTIKTDAKSPHGSQFYLLTGIRAI